MFKIGSLSANRHCRTSIHYFACMCTSIFLHKILWADGHRKINVHCLSMYLYHWTQLMLVCIPALQDSVGRRMPQHKHTLPVLVCVQACSYKIPSADGPRNRSMHCLCLYVYQPYRILSADGCLNTSIHCLCLYVYKHVPTRSRRPTDTST